MSKLASARAILAGAARALRDPRLLARLARTPPDVIERAHEAECRRLLGDAPRSVGVEAFVTWGRLRTYSFLDEGSPVLDLLALRGIVERYAARRFFEIGTFRGESALAAADAGAEVVTLSLPDDRLGPLSDDPSLVAAHRTVSGGDPRIRHVFADSHTADVSAWGAWADVLFIDGDHRRDAVESDTRRFWSVRRPGGVVVWHDGFASALRPRWEVLAGIAAGVPEAARAGLVHISNTLCVAWLPDAETLSTVERSYVPRVTYSVEVTLDRDWRSARAAAPAERVAPAQADGAGV